MIRYLTAGESHGQALMAIVEGLPAGIKISEEYINKQLARRQGGYGRGGRMAIEKDKVNFLSGVRGGVTTGAPITLQIINKDWENWSHIMSPREDAQLDQRVVTKPRPGHADLSGALKYGHNDVRNILERASARETAIRVAVGTLVRKLLEELGLEIFSHVVIIGGVETKLENHSYDVIKANAAQSELACADKDAETKMIEEIKKAKESGDTLGGVFEVIVTGAPMGLGSHVQWDRKLDGRLAFALMSIQAIKGVEIGLGFKTALIPGSQVHDEIYYEQEKGFYRLTNGAGGIEGGMTNGEPIILRAAMKPIPTLYTPLKSVDLLTKEPYEASVERSDTCAVTAAGVVGEAVVSVEIANALMEKFGGDSLLEIKRNIEAYLETIRMA